MDSSITSVALLALYGLLLLAMNAYEEARSRKIARNEALVRDLGIQSLATSHPKQYTSKPPATKKRKLELSSQPTRTSARLASAQSRPSYKDDANVADGLPVTNRKLDARTRTGSHAIRPVESASPASSQPAPDADVESIRASWTVWKPVAPPPTRDNVTGTFHFESYPTFAPNKSPAEMLREGAFGGSYFRPLYSAKLRTTIEDDWKELPTEWIEGLNVEKYLISPYYDAEINKYKVSCGQSIEQWEQNGWIDHHNDVRGWFQWYCRFFVGRRCNDDERQVSRWAKCVGEKGRWRRTLLKKYKQLGIRDVMTYGDDDEENDVSPVVHQTCHHVSSDKRTVSFDGRFR